VLCPNPLLDYPKEKQQNPSSASWGLVTLLCVVFRVFLSSNMTLIRSVCVVRRVRDKHWPKLWMFLLSLLLSYNCIIYC
jgi:hypothetical protein